MEDILAGDASRPIGVGDVQTEDNVGNGSTALSGINQSILCSPINHVCLEEN